MRITLKDILMPGVSHEKVTLPFPRVVRALRDDRQVHGRRYGGQQDGGQNAKVKFKFQLNRKGCASL